MPDPSSFDTSREPFYSPKLTLGWAKKNISDLKRKRDRFNNINKRTRVIEINPHSLAKEYKIKPAGSAVIESFSELVASAIGHLRVSLDHATYAVAKCSGKTSPKRACFPFGDDSDGLEHVIGRGGSKDVPEDILALIRTFKPYKTGNALLWAMNRMANSDKHITVTLASATADRLLFYGSKAKDTPTPTLLLPSAPIYSSNGEIIFAFGSPEIGPDYDVHLTFDIAFGESSIDVISGQPAIAVLDDMIRIVESILLAIEAETRRIFPGAF